MDIINENGDCEPVNDQRVYELIDRIRNCDSRSSSDYFSLKSLLEDHSNLLSNNVLETVLEVLSDPSIYTLHDEETTIMLELHLRTLLAAVYAFSCSESCLKQNPRYDLFIRLMEFAKFQISGDVLRSKDVETISTNEKIFMRNYNIGFLLWILRDMIHDMYAMFNQTSDITVVDLDIVEDERITSDVNTQLLKVFNFKNPVSSWYSQWKKLFIILQNLINSKNLDERILLEQLWSYGLEELKQPKDEWDDTIQNINALILHGNDPTIARSLWFGILDLSQELATTTQSLANLVFIYYLALQSLQNAPNIHIRSKAIEVLIIISKKHKMLNAQFVIDFQDMLKVLREVSSNHAVKFQKLFNIISRRCLVAQNIIFHKSQFNDQITSGLDRNIKADDQSQKQIYDILSSELTCPITQDMSEKFQKLPCGHFLSVQAIETWSDECRSKEKLFSCCLCRSEFQFEEIQDEQISAMHQGLYQQLILVKDISNIQNNMNILGKLAPFSLINSNQEIRGKKKTLGMFKKAHPAYSKAKTAIKEEKFPIAIFWLNRLLDNWPDSYSIRCERAYALQQLGDFHQSICDLNIAVHFNPKKIQAWCLLGSVYHQMENNKLALLHVTKALNLEPTNQQGLLTRGLIYTKMNRTNDALKDFDTLLNLDSHKMISSQSTSKISSILQMLHLERIIFNNTINKDPIVECLRKRSMIYFKKNKFQLVKQDLDRLLYWEPKDRDALLLRGKTHQLMNEFDLAIEDFDKALTMDPRDSWVINRRARCLSEIGRRREAINDSNTALKYNPSNGYFYTSRSYIVTSFGYLDQALDYAHLASIIDRSNKENVYRRAWAYFHLQQYGDAIHDLEIPISDLDDDDPENAWKWSLGGFILHFFKKEHDDAFTYFNKAIELDPDLVDIYCYRGQLYTFCGEYDKALQDLNNAIGILSHETYLYQNLGHLYYEMGEYNLALETLNNAEKLLSGYHSNFPNQIARSRILTYRGMTYHKLEKYTEALDNLNQAIEIQVNNHDVVPIVERGLLYYSMGEMDKALIDLEEGLKITPKNDYICQSLRNARLCKGKIYLSREQNIEATDEIEESKILNSSLQNRWNTDFTLSKERKDEIKQIIEVGNDLLREARAGFEDGKIIFDRQTFNKILSQWEKVLEIEPFNPQSYPVVSALRLMRKYHQDLIKPSPID
ncbi:hypothetical protein C1645_839104 [Glomus cerebriforme]|uniref:TPR-like protein n=1 Tax=Glomus cerebriforme TaxID=658196 RepID=A0A397S183_9GLOM|nr:hypothetical protein C1645_839104 [Glomus cerebriforme]